MTVLDTAELRRKAFAAKARGSWVVYKPSGLIVESDDRPTFDEQIALLEALDAARAEIAEKNVEIANYKALFGRWEGKFAAEIISELEKRLGEVHANWNGAIENAINDHKEWCKLQDADRATIAQLRAERDEARRSNQVFSDSNAALTFEKITDRARIAELESQIASERESGLRRAAEIVGYLFEAGEISERAIREAQHTILAEIGEKK